MNFVLSLPTLENIALNTSTVFIWKQYFLTTRVIINTGGYAPYIDWLDIENNLCQYVDPIVIPNLFKQKLVKIIKCIGCELHEWLLFIISIINIQFIPLNMLKAIVNLTKWTIHGKIDVTESIKKILPELGWLAKCLFSENFKFLDRENMPTIDELFLLVENCKHFPSFEFEFTFELDKMKSCWSQTTEEDRNNFIKELAYLDGGMYESFKSISQRKNGIAVTCFILSQIKDEELRDDLLTEIGGELCCNLVKDWVYVQFFPDCLRRIMDIMCNGCYREMLQRIAMSTNLLHGDIVKECFTYAWTIVSAEKRRFVCEQELMYPVCCTYLCESQDLGNLNLVLSDKAFSVAERRLIISECFLWFVNNDLICKWDFLQLIAVKWISTDEEMNIFKQLCMEYIYFVCDVLQTNNDIFLRFLTFLNLNVSDIMLSPV